MEYEYDPATGRLTSTSAGQITQATFTLQGPFESYKAKLCGWNASGTWQEWTENAWEIDASDLDAAYELFLGAGTVTIGIGGTLGEHTVLLTGADPNLLLGLTLSLENFEPNPSLLHKLGSVRPAMGAATTHTIYGYDSFGRLASVTAAVINGVDQPDPAGKHRYTVSGQPVPAEGPTTLYTYDPVGNLDTVTLPNGVVEDYDYDGLNRLEKLTVTNAAGHKLFEQEYKLLPDGQRDYVIEKRYDGQSDMPFSKVKIDWTYDALNRLVAETHDADLTPGTDTPEDFGTPDATLGDYTDFFSFDLAGNRLLKLRGWDVNGSGQWDAGEPVSERIAYRYNARDQLLEETTDSNADGTPDSSILFAYDDNGNTTAKGSDSYTWDLRGRMSSATVNNTVTGYAYDHAGVRIGQTTGTDTHTFLYDKQNPTGYAKALQESVNGGLERSYVLGLRVEGQWAKDEVLGTFGLADQVWFIRDGHGSNRGLTGTDGAVLASYDYTAFGDAIGFIALDADTTELFGGDGVYDRATGWTYHLARWRDGHRFVSYDSFEADPTSPAYLHKYLYGNANPVYYVDPTGQFSFQIGDLLVSGSIKGYVLGTITFYAIGKAISATRLLITQGNLRNFEWFEATDLLSLIPGAAWGAVFTRITTLSSKLLTTVGGKVVGRYFGVGLETAAQAFSKAFGSQGAKFIARDGTEVLLQEGTAKVGFRHLLQRHVAQFWDGTKAHITTFWPTGTTSSQVLRYLDEAIRTASPQVLRQATKAPQTITLANGIVTKLVTFYEKGVFKVLTFYPEAGPGVHKAAQAIAGM